MNIDHITPSILHVIAKENLNIEDDLKCIQNQSLSELIAKEHEKEKQDKKEIPE